MTAAVAGLDAAPVLSRIPADARLGLAVSGGPDSLALLLVAHAERPGAIRAATIDHGLRPAATAEAAMVAELCAARGIPHEILPVAVTGSVQAGARAARYAALAQWAERQAVTHVATAHHLDDQAETVLMRLARGAGVAGLSGIRATRPLTDTVTLVRPLLHLRKADLEAIVAAAGLTPARDPSNADARFDRARIRRLLAGADDLDPARIAHSAAILREVDDALGWAAERLAGERIDGDLLDPRDLPPELLRRLAARLFARFGATPDGPSLARALATLAAGRAATIGGVKVTPGARWRFAPAPPRRNRC
jgi:tRNA(Ile)-lysidine synthase